MKKTGRSSLSDSRHDTNPPVNLAVIFPHLLVLGWLGAVNVLKKCRA